MIFYRTLMRLNIKNQIMNNSAPASKCRQFVAGKLY